MAVIEPLSLYVVAGGFPAGLNTETPVADLKPDETPDGYGFDIGVDGRLKKGTIPSGTARVQRSLTILEGASNITYYWHYRRLWNITNRTTNTASNILTYGAMDYDDIYVPQRQGKLHLNEDNNTITALVPFGQDSLFVGKGTGGYVVSNIADTRALLNKTDLMQEVACAAATYAVELDGVVYVSNANGLFSTQGAESKELFRKIRGSLTGMVSLALVADYSKKRIIGGSAFVYEPETEKIFKYSSSAFRYTTRQFHLPTYDPMDIARVWFIVQRTGTGDAWLTYQVRYEDEDWQEEVTRTWQFEPERYTAIAEDMADARRARRFQLRITDMSSNLSIREIRMDNHAFNADDYST